MGERKLVKSSVGTQPTPSAIEEDATCRGRWITDNGSFDGKDVLGVVTIGFWGDNRNPNDGAGPDKKTRPTRKLVDNAVMISSLFLISILSLMGQYPGCRNRKLSLKMMMLDAG